MYSAFGLVYVYFKDAVITRRASPFGFVIYKCFWACLLSPMLVWVVAWGEWGGEVLL